MKIEKDKVVFIDYTLKNSEGDVLDSSIGQEPLPYVHGAGDIIVGLEKALEGKQSGEKINVTVLAQDGYGEYLEELVREASKDEFSDIQDLKEGTHFEVEIETEEGPQVTMATILEVGSDSVKFDMNHPLAGEDLHFEIEVKNVRDQSPEEADTGRILSPNGD